MEDKIDDSHQLSLTEMKNKLNSLIKEKIYHYNRWAKFWTTVYHGCLYTSIIASAAAALILKLEGLKNTTVIGLSQNDMSTILATVAAICGTLLAGGSAGRKWKANCVARREAEQLEIDLETVEDLSGIHSIRNRLKEIIRNQNEGIIGAE